MEKKITRREKSCFMLVAEKYFNEKELSRLNRLVNMLIEYAELIREISQGERKCVVKNNWI